MRISIDNPDPGHWIFGFALWRNDEGAREILIGFYKWAVCLTFGGAE